MIGLRMVENYISFLRFEKRYSPHTLVAYQGDLNQFRKYISEQYQLKDWDKVETMHARSWIYKMAEDVLDKKTINRKISCLRNFFQFLVKEGEVSANPVLAIQSMKTSRTLPEVLPEQTIKQYFELTEQHTWGEARDKMLIALLYETGMRRAELLELGWSDVHLSSGSILVTGKRQKQRQIPIRAPFAEQLRQFRDLTKDHFGAWQEYVMLTDRGNKVYPKWIYNKVKSILGAWTRRGHISPHVLRHSIATHLLDSGADIQVIREILGHSSLAATQIYTHNSIEKLKQSYHDALPNLDVDIH